MYKVYRQNTAPSNEDKIEIALANYRVSGRIIKTYETADEGGL